MTNNAFNSTKLEKVQKRAAIFLPSKYTFEEGSMTGILAELKLEPPLQKRRKDSRLTLLYKGLKGKVKIQTDDLIQKTDIAETKHSLAFQTPFASTNIYKHSFFPRTIRNLNDLSDSLITSGEMPGDCVFSIVRNRD